MTVTFFVTAVYLQVWFKNNQHFFKYSLLFQNLLFSHFVWHGILHVFI